MASSASNLSRHTPSPTWPRGEAPRRGETTGLTEPKAAAASPAAKAHAPKAAQKSLVAKPDAPAAAGILTPRVQAMAKDYGKTAIKVVCGLGVVAGLSWGMAAVGATAGLMRVLAGASVLDRVANSVPFIGPLLAVLMGVGGNYGFTGVGLIVFNVVEACFSGTKDWAAAFRWINAHAAIAFALSPLWLPAATALTVPVLAGVAVGVSYLSWTVARAQQTATPPSFSHALFALGVALGLSPVGAQAASGVSGINILRQAVNFPLLAFGCNAIVSAGRQLYTLFGSSGSGGAGASQPIHTQGAKIAMPGEHAADATVFVPRQVAVGLEDVLYEYRAQISKNKHDGPRCILLQAPHGCGKRVVGSALANALQTRMYKVERETFESTGKGHSGQALAQQLNQWAQEAKQLGKPVVLYVPELLQLAPKVAAGAGGGATDSDDFTSQLKTLMASESGGEKPNLLFVLGTTHSPEEVEAGTDDAIRNRITRRFTWQAPDADNLADILRHKVKLHLQGSVLHEELYAEMLQEPQLTALLGAPHAQDERLRQAAQLRISGAQVDAWVVEALDAVVARYLRQHQSNDALGPDDADTSFALAEALQEQLGRAWARRLPQLGRAGNQNEPDPASDSSDTETASEGLASGASTPPAAQEPPASRTAPGSDA